MALVTQNRAKKLLEYTAENGTLAWKKTNSNVAKKDTIAGYVSKTDNRVSVRISAENKMGFHANHGRVAP